MDQIPILILGHGNFPRALFDSAQMLIGKRKNVFTLSLHEDDNLESYITKVQLLLHKIINVQSILVFVDIQGGTPWNSILGINDRRVWVITGINLPILIEVLCLRDNINDIDKLVTCAIDTAHASFVVKELNG